MVYVIESVSICQPPTTIVVLNLERNEPTTKKTMIMANFRMNHKPLYAQRTKKLALTVNLELKDFTNNSLQPLTNKSIKSIAITPEPRTTIW